MPDSFKECLSDVKALQTLLVRDLSISELTGIARRVRLQNGIIAVSEEVEGFSGSIQCSVIKFVSFSGILTKPETVKVEFKYLTVDAFDNFYIAIQDSKITICPFQSGLIEFLNENAIKKVIDIHL